jgi:Fe2+ or Zn2+ uptake regulation protein
MAAPELRKQLASRGLRLTRQREAILNVLRQTTDHPDAYWIYTQVRERLPGISLGTVYRALKAMSNAGLIRELAYGDRYSRYDGDISSHSHVTCLRCHRMADLRIPDDPDLAERAAAESGFQIRSQRTEFEGLCPECAKALADPMDST